MRHNHYGEAIFHHCPAQEIATVHPNCSIHITNYLNGILSQLTKRKLHLSTFKQKKNLLCNVKRTVFSFLFFIVSVLVLLFVRIPDVYAFMNPPVLLRYSFCTPCRSHKCIGDQHEKSYRYVSQMKISKPAKWFFIYFVAPNSIIHLQTRSRSLRRSSIIFLLKIELSLRKWNNTDGLTQNEKRRTSRV